MSQNRKAQAVVFPKVGQVAIQEVDIPGPASNEVLIEIEYSSLSNGTERWCLTGRLNLPGERPLAFPHVPGYQAAGIVRQIGPEVKGLKSGDRVFSRNCRQPNHWDGSWWGGHVGWHVADYQDVIRLPDAVSTIEASSLLLAQVGFNGANKPRISPGDVAVVIGEGLVGQFASQVLRYRGAHVIMAGLQQSGLEKALQHSADEVFANTKNGLPEFIREKYPQGVEIVLDTASTNKTVRMGIELLKREGQLVMNGFYPEPESRLDWHWLRTKEITTYCPDSRTRPRLEKTLRLIEQGHIKVKELVASKMNIDDSPQAYQKLLDPSADFMGIVLDWQGNH